MTHIICTQRLLVTENIFHFLLTFTRYRIYTVIYLKTYFHYFFFFIRELYIYRMYHYKIELEQH